MLSYAHIGLPKTGTTFLQNNVFPVHPELHNIGKHKRPVDLPYDVRRLLFTDLINTPEYLFDARKAARKIDAERHRISHGTDGKRAFGLSSELLTNLFQGRVSLTERATRLALVMGRQTRIIFFVREQVSWLKSIYATYVREGGLCTSFEDFCFHLCFEEDVSAKANLFYDRIYQTYADVFGADQVLVIPYEDMRAQPQQTLNRMCGFLDVSEQTFDTETRYHERPSPQALGAMMALNRHWRFGLGGPAFRRMGGHRIEEAYADYGLTPPDYLAQDKEKHMFMYRPPQVIIDKAAKLGLDASPLALDVPPAVSDHLTAVLAPHNRALQDKTGMSLAAHGYIL